MVFFDCCLVIERNGTNYVPKEIIMLHKSLKRAVMKTGEESRIIFKLYIMKPAFKNAHSPLKNNG